MVGIVIISHGDLASGLITSLEMIDPGQKQIASLSIHPDTNPDDFCIELKNQIGSVSTGDGVLILADILGGTPCNKAICMLGDDVNVLTGVNLPMLLSAVTKRLLCTDGDTLCREVIQEATDGISNLKELLREESENDKSLKNR